MHSERNYKKTKCLPTEWERYLQTVYQISDHIQNVTGTHTIQHQQTKQNKTNPTKKYPENQNRPSPKEDLYKANGDIKKNAQPL